MSSHFFMDEINKSIKRNAIQYKNEFQNDCEVLIINNDNKPILQLGIDKYQSFHIEIQKLFKMNKEVEFYYFQKCIDENEPIREVIPSITMFEYIEIINSDYLKHFDDQDHFYKQNTYFIIKYDKRKSLNKDIVIKIFESILNIHEKYNIKFTSLNSLDSDEGLIDFHCLCTGIYISYKYNEKSDKSEKVDKSYGDIGILKEYIVKDFKDLVENKIERLWSSSLEMTPFFMQNNRSNKLFKEELILLYHYIKAENISDNLLLKLGKDSDRWDARIGNIIIEVTQAVYQNEHLVRKKLCNLHGFRGLSLRLRTINQFGIDSFPFPIINSFNKKIKKEYGDDRTLIIGTLYEFCYNDKKVLDLWLKYIIENIDISKFKELVLCMDEDLYYIY